MLSGELLEQRYEAPPPGPPTWSSSACSGASSVPEEMDFSCCSQPWDTVSHRLPTGHACRRPPLARRQACGGGGHRTQHSTRACSCASACISVLVRLVSVSGRISSSTLAIGHAIGEKQNMSTQQSGAKKPAIISLRGPVKIVDGRISSADDDDDDVGGESTRARARARARAAVAA